jgi:DMSO/TMAO reductase YedYZ heme-binding membrane subunit
MQKLIDTISNFFIQKSPLIIKWLPLVYFGFVLFVWINLDTRLGYRLSNTFGEIAVGLYVLTLIPGIAGRLGLKNSIFNVIRVYRRHLGISMYLFAFSHFFIKRFPFTFPPSFFAFEVAGMLAIFVFFLLFVTSNNFSQKLLTKNWFLLQKLTYLGMFFIFLHLAFLKVATWGTLMALVILLEVISFIYLYTQKSANKIS